jgi:dihydroxyacetone kinase
MRARLRDFIIAADGHQHITLTLVGEDFRARWDALRNDDVEVEIKKRRERRGLAANAYFHVLVHAIAAKLNVGEDAVKEELVLNYGALAKDDDGKTLWFLLPDFADARLIYKYTKAIARRVVGGQTLVMWAVYKRTHTLDSAEMARLISGAVSDARELGIETLTPDELAKLQYYNKEISK